MLYNNIATDGDLLRDPLCPHMLYSWTMSCLYQVLSTMYHLDYTLVTQLLEEDKTH